MSSFFQVTTYLLFLYGLCVLVMYMRQDSFLFFPTSNRHVQYHHENVIDYSLKRDDVTLRGWLVNPALIRKKLIIYYGGNGEDVFFNIDEFSEIQAASLFVAYRGYGPSSGKPGEKELFADALAIIDDVVSNYSPKQIVLVGRSLGSGVACFTAANRDVQGVALVSPYDSIVNVARAHYPWLPVTLLLRHRFASIDYIGKINCPVLIVYGGRDTIISPKRTKNLIRYITQEKEVIYLEQADHGNIEMYPDYWSGLLRFIDQTSE